METRAIEIPKKDFIGIFYNPRGFHTKEANEIIKLLQDGYAIAQVLYFRKEIFGKEVVMNEVLLYKIYH